MTDNEFILNVRRLLRIEDWVIREDLLPGGKWDSEAYVTMDREHKIATLHMTEAATREQVAHEMVHVMLHDMAYVASEGASVDRMTFYNMLEERACNIIAPLLMTVLDDAEG